jgi:putative Holliday junction resolvase
LVIEEEAEGVVVGLPLNMDGSEGSAAIAARREVERMATVVGVPVFLHDERRSTVQADQSMSKRDMNAVDRRAVVDKVAAAFILQSWLDARGNESEQ